MKISILSFVPFPMPDESPISAIQRTARANGFKNCHSLLAYLSKTTSLLTYGNCLLDNSAVSRALQVCAPKYADRIKANFYHTAHPLLIRANATVKGVEISYLNFRRKETALCTECLIEEHERFPRDIRLFSNCPFHNRAFLVICPTCNTRIKWKMQLTCYCECGERLVSPKVSDSEMALDQYLLQLFRQGNAVQIASIQRILATLEHETHSTDDAVRTARCALAIAISRRDVESMTNEIHKCLPSSSAEAIDVILTIFDNELGKSITTTLRQRLISTTAEQKSRVAKVTLSVRKIQEYVGISQSTWYNLKYHHDYFRGIGRGAKISLERAIKLRKTLTSDKELDHNPVQKNLNDGHKRLLSISAVQRLTDMPKETIKTLALETNLLGLKKYYIKQTEKGSELIFGRAHIDLFNQHYICSNRLAREWSIPIRTINNIIQAHHFQLKKFEFIRETIIIKKNLSLRLFSIVKSPQPFPSQCKKWLDVPRTTLSSTTEYLTDAACARLLSIALSEIKIMIRERIIPCHRKDSLGRYLISKQEALDFGKNHFRVSELSKKFNISPKKVSPLLSSAGILPISGPLVNSGKLHFYKKSSIPSATIKSLRIRRKTPALMPLNCSDKRNVSAEFCVNINSICEKYFISKSSFHYKFLGNGLIQYKKFRSDKYITAKDSKKIFHILNNYISYDQAAASLNVSLYYIRRLVSTKKLILDNSFFHPIKNPGLVSRKQLEELRLKLSTW